MAHIATDVGRAAALAALVFVLAGCGGDMSGAEKSAYEDGRSVGSTQTFSALEDDEHSFCINISPDLDLIGSPTDEHGNHIAPEWHAWVKGCEETVHAG